MRKISSLPGQGSLFDSGTSFPERKLPSTQRFDDATRQILAMAGGNQPEEIAAFPTEENRRQLDRLQEEMHALVEAKDGTGLKAFVLQHGIYTQEKLFSDFGSCPHDYRNEEAYLLDNVGTLDSFFAERRQNGAPSFEAAKRAMTERCAQTTMEIGKALTRKKPR